MSRDLENNATGNAKGQAGYRRFHKTFIYQDLPGWGSSRRWRGSKSRRAKLACVLPLILFHQGMFPHVTLTRDRTWQSGPYPGVELMILHQNEATGGVTVLRKFKKGVKVPAHIHPLANESVYILSGEWEESDVTYTTGAFFFAPRGQRHGPHVAKTDVVSLTTFDGPLTVQEA